MFRKLIKVVVAFAALVAGYVGYDHGFGILAAFMSARMPVSTVPRIETAIVVGSAESAENSTANTTHRTLNSQHAVDLARRAFGEGHWATDPDLTMRYYNSESGYWVYAGGYKRHSDGYRVEFFPFALIWENKDRTGFKAISGERAFADFAEKFDPFKSGSKPTKIRAAKIEGDVVIRDWRDQGRGDLTIGPLAYLEYDEQVQQIKSEDTPVTIRDRDLMITCVGVLIDLLPTSTAPPKPGTPPIVSSFGGVSRIRLMRDVHIVHDNIGSTGFMNGSTQAASSERVPFELSCAGEAGFELPPPSPKPATGASPPAPAPTIARFQRNVVLKRGQPVPDQLDCDTLIVKLFPVDMPTSGTEESSTESELEIRDARASGHAVWLQSPGQGFRALGNELIYRKLGTAKAPSDETYFSANRGTGLRIDKTDVATSGPSAGKVTSYTTIETIDATILQTGEGPAKQMTILARGPGRLESRPEVNQPADRIATWQDMLRLRSDADQRRMITLTGSPSFQDLAQAKISARDSIILSLKPRSQPIEALGPPHAPLGSRFAPAPQPYPSETGESKGPGQVAIEWVRALNDVHLTSFSAPRAGEAGGEEEGPAPSSRTMVARESLNVVFEQPPEPSSFIAGESAASVPPPAAAETAEAPAVEPTDKTREPQLDVSANSIWARIASLPDSKTKFEAREVRLRGAVEVHRGAEREGERGTDVSGDAVDLIGQANNRFRVRAHGTVQRPALVVSDAFRIVGPKLTVDQVENTADVEGPGELTQWVETREELAPGGAPPLLEANGRPNRRPMVISWKSNMRFEGERRSEDGKNSIGYAHFLSGVVATIDEARIAGEELDVYLNQPVSLSGAPKKQGDQPKLDLSHVRAKVDVEITNKKLDPATGTLLEYQRINGQDVSYQLPGRFQVSGPGLVRIYGRNAGGEANPSAPPRAPRDGNVAGRGLVSPVSNQRTVAALAPLELTRVEFRQGMRGRFQGPPQAPTNGERIAEFWGDVHVLHARVADEKADLTEDMRPAPDDMIALQSQYLWVDNLPGIGDDPAKSASRTRMLARGDGQAARARTYGANASVIEGDRITYHTDTGTFLIVADQGDVLIARSNGVGRPVSLTDARQVLYNTRTGKTSVVDPGQISLYEPKTAARPEFAPVPQRMPKPEKPPTYPNRPSDRASKERQGFSGTSR